MASRKDLHRHPMNRPGNAAQTASGACRAAKAVGALAEWAVFRQALYESKLCATAAHRMPAKLRYRRFLPGIRECDMGPPVLPWRPLGAPPRMNPLDESAQPICVPPVTALPDRE